MKIEKETKTYSELQQWQQFGHVGYWSPVRRGDAADIDNAHRQLTAVNPRSEYRVVDCQAR